jgi:aspartate/methionine/tyrosine aminotransferase
MIVINNPNNPSGAAIPKFVLEQIVEFAKSRDIIILSDEVYRPLFHKLFDEPSSVPPSMNAFGYSKTIAVGSMSKAYALAGIRIGWIASRDKEIVDAIAAARDYTTISVSQIDDQIATYALSDHVLPSLLKRNIDLARTNLGLLADFIHRYQSLCSWVRPVAGTTAFIQFKNGCQPVEDASFSIDVLNETKVLVVPGSKCFGQGKDFDGYIRIGYVCHTEVLEEALDKLSAYVEKHFVTAQCA